MAVWLSQRVVLAQSREDPSLRAGQPYLLLCSGNTFGTGAHPTTRICVTLLEEILREGQSVLDLGSGSGILALSAALLRARRVIAIDHDLEACRVARHNVGINAMNDTVHVVNGRLEALSDQAVFDVVLANLELQTLVEVVPRLTAHLSPDGCLVVSGVQLAAQAQLANLLVHAGLVPAASCTEGEWIGFLASPAP